MKSYSSDVQRHLAAVVVEKVWLKSSHQSCWSLRVTLLGQGEHQTPLCTRLFAAVMLASPNTATSTGFFCWSVRPTFRDMYSVQFFMEV